MKNIKKSIFLTVFLIIFGATCPQLFAQSYSIDYYGIIAQNLDDNMAKITSDFYYTQLSEIPNFTIYDKRTLPSRSTKPDFTTISTDNLIFFTEIVKDDNSEKWNAIFTLVNLQKNKQYAITKSYDSFYKVLMESKNIIQETIKELITEDPALQITEGNKKEKQSQPKSSGNKILVGTIEELSGTWTGETDIIDKIVILRGGRGFVIYNNGASMNITISLENNGQKVIITQKGNSNASFYPELPRNLALEAALTAPPIKWTMTLMDNMVLEGKKSTLIQTDTSYKQGEIDVTWEKVN